VGLKLRSLWRYRPRFLTLVVVAIVAAPMVLANLSSDIEASKPMAKAVHGWPFVWHWHNLAPLATGPPVGGDASPIYAIYSWDFSVGRLVANLAFWLLVVALPTAACEWAKLRYGLGPRFSMRTMLAAVAIVAGACGWFTAASRRADLQDSLIAAPPAEPYVKVWLKRSGPKWLDLVGADRLRRHILGAEIVTTRNDRAETVEEHLKRLAGLPKLRFLSLRVPWLTQGMIRSLGEMRQLREMRLEGSWEARPEMQHPAQECLAAIGRMNHLQHLHLGGMELHPENLSNLAGLNHLTSLSLSSVSDEPSFFAQLPPLPRLESIDVQHSQMNEDDLRQLAMLPRLKALGVRGLFLVAGERLDTASLATLASLEELALDCDLASPQTIQSLQALAGLKTLHVEQEYAELQSDSQLAAIELVHGDKLLVENAQRKAFVEAITSLQRTRPDIVIDTDTGAIAWKPDIDAGSEYHLWRDWYSHPDVIPFRRWLTPSEKAAFDAQSAKQ
jgi:hypothetical protein